MLYTIRAAKTQPSATIKREVVWWNVSLIPREIFLNYIRDKLLNVLKQLQHSGRSRTAIGAKDCLPSLARSFCRRVLCNFQQFMLRLWDITFISVTNKIMTIRINTIKKRGNCKMNSKRWIINTNYTLCYHFDRL